MTARKPWATIAAVIFLLMALAHVYRIVVPFEIMIGRCDIPQWASIVGTIVAGGLSLMLFRESRG